MSNLTDKEWLEAEKVFFENHPDAPKAKEVECLNLIMKKEFAEQILSGEKKVEFRTFSEHYVKRLYDRDVLNYIDEHAEEDAVEFMDCMRPIKKIHFHNYNNSWFLDVEVQEAGECAATKPWVKIFNEEFDCHELDQITKDLDKRKDPNRPLFFYFVIGKILETNI